MPTPPIKCKPCRVRVGGLFYSIQSNGDVYKLTLLSLVDHKFALDSGPLDADEAKAIRREASRLRRNRNAREYRSTMKSLGLRQTAYGWE